jgi:site-specific recombinase XerD
MSPRTLTADQAIRDRKQEEMRHPPSVWADPAYAEQDLHELREAYLSYLRGRAKPVASATVIKYNKTLLSFIASLGSHGDPITLAMVTPANVSRWVGERRARGLSEEGTATHLIALKVFTNKYVHKELELTRVDLLRKVPRLTPPEKPAQVLTEDEREHILACFDSPSYEDTRNKAFVATYMATGLRFKEVLELRVDQVDRFRGTITVTAKGGKERPAMLSPRALKLLREYLKIRPASDSDRLWLVAEGTPLAYTGGQEVFRKLKKRSGVWRIKAHLLRHGFAQSALQKGAHPGMVQEMLGHATPAMTRRYLGWAKQEEAAKQMPAYSPI